MNMRNNFAYYLGALTLIFLLVNQVDAKYRPRKINFCKLDHLFECIVDPLWRFTAGVNGTGFPPNEEAFENFCFNAHDVMSYCVKKFSEKCMTPLYRELTRGIYLKPHRDALEKFCDPQGELRAKFLRHVPCLIDHVKMTPKYRRECIRPFHASFEWTQHIHENRTVTLFEAIKSSCCIYHRWENCIVDQVTETCGQQSSTIITDFLNHFSAFMIPNLCNRDRYNLKSPTCECDFKEYDSPPEFVPKGIKSKSLISYLFASSCPNVGWGIDEKRDF